MNKPIVSVITINYKNKAGLERTFRSVFEQTYSGFEYIVIDGGSQDGSKELIEENAAKITYWVSEPDKGVYNAMNKGIRAAKGKYLFFLNSGDTFFNETVLSSFWQTSCDKDFVYGNVYHIDKDKTELITYPSELTFKFWFQGGICHQAVFMNRRCFEVAGLYDENFKIISDWKLLSTGFAFHNFSYEYRPVVISNYYLDGLSSDPKNRAIFDAEVSSVMNSVFKIFKGDYERLLFLEQRAKYFNPKKIFGKGFSKLLGLIKK